MRLYPARASRRDLLQGVACAAAAVALPRLRAPPSRRASDRRPTSSTRTLRTASNGAKSARPSSRPISAGRSWGRSAGKVGARSTRASDALTRLRPGGPAALRIQRMASRSTKRRLPLEWRPRLGAWLALAATGAVGPVGAASGEELRPLYATSSDVADGKELADCVLFEVPRRRWRQRDEGRSESRGPATVLPLSRAEGRSARRPRGRRRTAQREADEILQRRCARQCGRLLCEPRSGLSRRTRRRRNMTTRSRRARSLRSHARSAMARTASVTRPAFPV